MSSTPEGASPHGGCELCSLVLARASSCAPSAPGGSLSLQKVALGGRGPALALGRAMIPLLLALAALEPPRVTTREAPHSVVAPAGPGLGTGISEGARVYQGHDGFAVSVLPLHVGWRVAEGVPVDRPTRYGFAAVRLELGKAFEARVAELAVLEQPLLKARSFFINPVSVAVSRGAVLAPGWLDVSLRLDLTLSLWQSTHALGAPDESPPLLPCSSGSLAQLVGELVLLHDLRLGLVAGIGDDPVHFDDGADCLGGGPVWQSSRWLGARAELRVGRTFSLGVEVGHAEHRVHEVNTTGHEHALGTIAPHEHVVVRGFEGFEGGAWLALTP